MSTTINLTYFGMHGAGRTVTEAKQDAGRKIEKALTGSYAPELLGRPHHTYRAILWREPTCWSYHLLEHDTKPETLFGCSRDYGSRQDARRYVLCHLADLNDDVTLLSDPADIRDWQTKHDWVIRVRTAQAAGYSDEDARHVADGRPEMIQRHPVTA